MKPCTVCTHPDAEEINRVLKKGGSKRTVAQRFNLSESAVLRHKEHIKPTRAKPRATTVTLPDAPKRSLDEIAELEAECVRILEHTNVDKVRLDAIARLQSLRADRRRYAEESSGGTSLVADPAFQQIVGAMATALIAFPEAQHAVNAALEPILGTPLAPPVCSRCSEPIKPLEPKETTKDDEADQGPGDQAPSDGD